MTAKDFDFQLAHLGINSKDAEEGKATAALLAELFGFPVREGNSSIFVNEQFEVMKKPFRGTLGHFALTTNDAAGARKYLESKGIEFDESSASYDENGRLKLVYANNEIGGFAFHITQR